METGFKNNRFFFLAPSAKKTSNGSKYIGNVSCGELYRFLKYNARFYNGLLRCLGSKLIKRGKGTGNLVSHWIFTDSGVGGGRKSLLSEGLGEESQV